MSYEGDVPTFVERALLVTACTLCLVLTASGQLSETGDTTKPVLVRVTRPASPATIPSSVFGSFLEPIGHATYGGLWSDVIENPSFEEGLWSVSNIEALLRERPNLRRASSLGLPLPWEPLTDQGARYLPVIGDAAIQAAGSKTFVEGVLPQTETVSSKWWELLVMHNEPDESGSKCENPSLRMRGPGIAGVRSARLIQR